MGRDSDRIRGTRASEYGALCGITRLVDVVGNGVVLDVYQMGWHRLRVRVTSIKYII